MQIVIVVVLYKRSPAQSQTINSLAAAFERNPELLDSFGVFVWDNSPDRDRRSSVSISLRLPARRPQPGNLWRLQPCDGIRGVNRSSLAAALRSGHDRLAGVSSADAGVQQASSRTNRK